MNRLREKKTLFFMGMMIMILSSCVSFMVAERQIINQNKAVIGKLYEENPEVCESMVKDMFEMTGTKAELEKGENALLKMGYTKQGAEYLYRENGLAKLHWETVLIQIVVMLGLGGVFIRLEKSRQKEEQKLIQDIRLDVAQERRLEISGYQMCNKAVVYEIVKLLGTLQAKEKELKEKTQFMQIFMENIAHQIKTPLTCASVSLDLLSEQLTQDEQKEYVNQSFLYLKEIEILIKKILDIGRLEAGKLLMKKEAIQMEVLLKECIMLLDASNERITLEVEKENVELEYYGDYEWLKESFCNILKNSLEHDKSGKAIQIKLVQRKEQIFIQIWDHGPGIAEEDLKHIFDRFYIPKEAKKTHTGIGLNLAELVIRKHFGMITVHNHENGGALFSVLLPTYGMKNEKISFS